MNVMNLEAVLFDIYSTNCRGPHVFANPEKPERGIVIYSDPYGPIKDAMGIEV